MAVQIRRTERSDAPELRRLAESGFADSPDMRVWDEENIIHHVEVYPEGQFVAEDAKTGRLAGSATTMRVRHDRALRQHTWREVTGGSNLANHDPHGDILYGVDVVVHPRFRLGGVGRLLYEAREKLLETTDCLGFAAGGRLPNYHLFARYGMPADEYVRLVEQRVVRDPVLGFQLKRGMVPLDVLPGYLTDARSGNWSCLIYYANPSRERSAEVIDAYRKFAWAPPTHPENRPAPPETGGRSPEGISVPRGVARRVRPRQDARSAGESRGDGATLAKRSSRPTEK